MPQTLPPGQRESFLLVALLCPEMWEGRALAAGEEAGSVAPWREGQARVSLQTVSI